MQIEPWQVPVLAMALLALPPAAHLLLTKEGGVLGRKAVATSGGSHRSAANRLEAKRTEADRSAAKPIEEPSPKQEKRLEKVRVGIFVVATGVLTVVFLVALGKELADVVTSVAAAIVTLISATMAVKSRQNAGR